MFEEIVSIKVIGDIQKYYDRAEQLGYKFISYGYKPNYKNSFITLYPTVRNGTYNVFNLDNIPFLMNKEITQEEFFGETMNNKMNPKGVLEVLKAFGYTHICQNDDCVYAIAGEISTAYRNFYCCINSPVDSKLLNVEIDWPDPENKIYPPLKKFVEVELNSEYTAKVYKDKIEVGCQTFPITIIDKLAEASRKIQK